MMFSQYYILVIVMSIITFLGDWIGKDVCSG